MNIHQLFPEWNLLGDMVADGYVRKQTNGGDLWIYNYTEKAMFDSVWNHVTLTCRGLIINTATMEVVARPFKKFFNYNQPQAYPHMLEETVTAANKMDGSLGIWYRSQSGRPAIATRGSFSSDQAIRGTEMLAQQYGDWAPSNEEWTPLFEIIYPENRIVCDYDGVSDLVLLGAVHKATGLEIGAEQAQKALGWGGATAYEWKGITYAQALAMPDREGAEGLVIMDKFGHKVKFKQEDYMIMHKLVTGLSERAVWEMVDTDTPWSWRDSGTDKIKFLPDEFQPWAVNVLDGLISEWDRVSEEAQDRFMHLRVPGMSRKDFAIAVKDEPNRAFLFKLMDWYEAKGEDPLLDMDKMIWQTLRPVGDTRMWNGKGEEDGSGL